MKISNILLVGAGELGSRHLQSLVKDGIDNEQRRIFVYDPSETSLNLSKKRAKEVGISSNATINYSKNLDFNLDFFDLAIIATNAAVRLSAIKEVLRASKIKFLLLEKILFQNVEHLQESQNLITENIEKCWVNCPRRIFPFYEKLRNTLQTDAPIHMTVKGNKWGMACNSIHFIDLWFYLAGITSYSIDFSQLSDVVFDSKRTGFKEVEGKITCFSGSNELILECCNSKETTGMEIGINCGNYSILVDEANGYYETTNIISGDKSRAKFDALYQSEMTGKIAKEMFFTDNCGLTVFEESNNIHSPFLDGLLQYFRSNAFPEIDYCPIT